MRKNGFTLVELSIVLVIIGLLIGGILVGQALIDSAKIRSAVNAIQQYDIAISTFRSKFKGLPGDTSKMGCVNGGASGNICNNGLITSLTILDSYGAPGIGADLDGETGRVWVDLQTNGLNASGRKYVAATDMTALKASFPVIKTDTNAYIWVNSCFNSYGANTCYKFVSVDSDNNTIPSMKPVSAAALDQKLDDGKPYSGDAQNWSGIDNPSWLTNDQCDNGSVDSGAGQPWENSPYSLDHDSVSCYMEIRILSSHENAKPRP